MESRAVVQFAELVHQAVTNKFVTADVMVWMGDVAQVAHGAMPDVVMVSVCPACHKSQAHLVRSVGNWDQYVCLECGFRHSLQLTKGDRS